MPATYSSLNVQGTHPSSVLNASSGIESTPQRHSRQSSRSRTARQQPPPQRMLPLATFTPSPPLPPVSLPTTHSSRPRRQSLVANDSQLGGPLPLQEGHQSYLYHVDHRVPPQASLRAIAPAPGPSSRLQTPLHPSQQQHQQVQHQRQQAQQQEQRQQPPHQVHQQQPWQQPQQQPIPTRAQPFPNNISPSLHPQFRAKAVCRLTCRSCLTDVCMRGMRAILLADARVELYSTDRPPAGVQLVYDDYRTRNCKCRIRDVACLGCGNTLGYHVTQPCESCLEACNNGHFWMFHSDGVSCTERYLPKTRSSRILASDGLPSSSPSLALSTLPPHRQQRQQQEQEPDLSFRRRTSIHDIEYNNAVRPSVSTPPTTRVRDGTLAHEEDKEEEDDDDEDEESPVVMLWAALHAQEERYLQQMQQQLVQQQRLLQLQQLQQQQQQLQQQQQQLQQQQQQLQQQQRQLPQPEQQRHLAPPLTVGSLYHSTLSTTISNASMTLWDEGSSVVQYEHLCR